MMLKRSSSNEKNRVLHPDDEKAQCESRLYWLLWTALDLLIDFLGFTQIR